MNQNQKLSDRVARIDEDTFQVKSGSRENHFYVISEGKCECLGFRFNGKCSHLKLVEEFKKNE